MNYWKIIFYTGEGEFETNELIINDEEYQKVQQVLSSGGDLIILRNRPVIKRSLIASITKASQEFTVVQRIEAGISGLIKSPKMEKSGDFLKRSHVAFYQRMDWDHRENCVCKTFIGL